MIDAQIVVALFSLIATSIAPVLRCINERCIVSKSATASSYWTNETDVLRLENIDRMMTNMQLGKEMKSNLLSAPIASPPTCSYCSGREWHRHHCVNCGAPEEETRNQ